MIKLLEKDFVKISRDGFYKEAIILKYKDYFKFYTKDSIGHKYTIQKFNSQNVRSFKSLDLIYKKLNQVGVYEFTLKDKTESEVANA